MALMGLSLVVYALDGARRGRVENLDLTWYAASGSAPTIKLSVSELQARAQFFSGEVEAAIEITNSAGVWVEPVNARCLISSDGWERINDGAKVHAREFVGIAARLAGAQVRLDQGVLNSDGKRNFVSVTPGALMATLLSEAKALGSFPTITYDFTDLKDSRGATWPVKISRAFDGTIDLWAVLTNLYEAGVVDFWMQGRTLRMVPVDTMGVDRTIVSPPVWLRDLGVASSPEKVDYTRRCNRVFVQGEGSNRWVFTGPNFGAEDTRSVSLSLGGVNDQGTAKLAADRLLLAGRYPAKSFTREWTDGQPGATWMPGRDLGVGDWVFCDTSDGHKQRMQIADMSLRAKGAGPVTAFVTLGTVIDSLVTRLAKRQKGIEGGSGVTSGGAPIPQTGLSAKPAAPTGLLITPAAYIDTAGKPQGRLACSWQPVTTEDNGTLMAVDRYRVFWRINSVDGGWQQQESTATSLSISPIPVRAQIQVCVAARGQNGQWGAASVSQVITVPDDVTAPAVPSAPVVDPSLGMLEVRWDGKTSAGSGMDADTAFVEIVDTRVSPNVVLGKIEYPVLRPFVRQDTIGAQYRLGLRAVDQSGNTSVLSTLVDVTIKSVLTETDLAAQLSQMVSATTAAQNAATTAQSTATAASQTATAAHNKAVAAQADATKAINDTATLAGKAKAVASATAPADTTVLWIDTASGNKAKIWNGSTWVVVQDAGIQAAATAAATAQTTANNAQTVADQAKTAAQTADAKATTALTSANGRNSRIRSASPASGTTHPTTGLANVTGDTWWQIDGNNYAIGQWGWNGSTWVAEKITDNVIANLDVLKLTVSGSAHINQAVITQIIGDAGHFNLLTAKQIAVTSGENIVVDPLMQIKAQWETTGVVWSATGGKTGSGSITIAAVANQFGWFKFGDSPGRSMVVSAGNTYRVTAWVKSSIDLANGQVVVWAVTDTAGSAPLASFGPVPANTWTKVEGSAGLISADGAAALVIATGVTANASIIISDITISQMAGGTLITPGGVLAPHLGAASVTSDKIAVGALDFKTATGLQITSGLFQTSANANTGIKINNTGLQGWNAAGTRMVLLDAATGNVDFGGGKLTLNGSSGELALRGIIRSGRYPSYPWTEINDQLWADFTGIRFYHKTGALSWSEIKTNPADWSAYSQTFPAGSLFLSSGGALTAGKGSDFILTESKLYAAIKVNNTAVTTLDLSNDRTILNSAWSIDINTPGQISFYQARGFQVRNLPAGSSTGLNLYISNDWYVHYTGSTRALKTAIEPLSIGYSVLDLQPVLYEDKKSSENGDHRKYWGFIADDVKTISDARGMLFEPLLGYLDGKLATFNYQVLPVAHHKVLQIMKAEIDSLKQKIILLEGKING